MATCLAENKGQEQPTQMGGGPVVGLGFQLAPLRVTLVGGAQNTCAFGWGLDFVPMEYLELSDDV